MVRADYAYQIKEGFRTEIYIVDQNLGNMSVTNCIEDVVEEIKSKERITHNDLSVVYCDSEGVWDGWDHTNENFIPLNGSTGVGAMQKLLFG